MLKIRFMILMVILALVAAACSTNATPKPGDKGYPVAAQPTTAAVDAPQPAAGYPVGNQQGAGFSFTVTNIDGKAKTFTLDELKKIASAKITVDGKNYEGPKLSEVLKSGGLDQYKYILINGVTGSIMVNKEDISATVIFDLSAGRVDLTGATLAKAKWLKGITSIKAETK
jgi:hypothetical protein